MLPGYLGNEAARGNLINSGNIIRLAEAKESSLADALHLLWPRLRDCKEVGSEGQSEEGLLVQVMSPRLPSSLPAVSGLAALRAVSGLCCSCLLPWLKVPTHDGTT